MLCRAQFGVAPPLAHSSPVLGLCLPPIRYPRSRAVPRAVWRGSTTDPYVSAVSVANIQQLARYRLHVLTDLRQDVIDARITKVCDCV